MKNNVSNTSGEEGFSPLGKGFKSIRDQLGLM
jgi:hypothetical protein